MPRIWRLSTASCTICACPSSRPATRLGHLREPGTHRHDAVMLNGQPSSGFVPPLSRPVGRAFDVTYEDLDAKQAFCHQTTYGMSERLLGAVVGMHGDETGSLCRPRSLRSRSSSAR